MLGGWRKLKEERSRGCPEYPNPKPSERVRKIRPSRPWPGKARKMQGGDGKDQTDATLDVGETKETKKKTRVRRWRVKCAIAISSCI